MQNDRDKQRLDFMKRHNLGTNGEEEKHYENDQEILKKHYQFVRSSSSESSSSNDQYGEQLAQEYERKLFRDYAVADLSKSKEGKLGLRWRNEKEVLLHKGELICASITCSEDHDLKSSLVNFAYRENGEMKQCLVKLCLCPSCDKKLEKVHHKRKKQERKLRKEEEKKKLKKELKLLQRLYEKEKKTQ